ncbi:RNase adapter RapZ [Selenomonadales bacterium OttesenSCG-928-I06]|nr:RNase adapter RapZ [Selenomonadales bacterium OttesenSCG-928-I06]
MDDIRLVIVTGMSGGGKSGAIKIMEDLGYFCVDNLPPLLIPKITELCEQSNGKVRKVALVVDIRGREFFGALVNVLEELDESGFLFEVLFLEASDEVIIRRYKESRRRHPMALTSGRISEGIAQEKDKLKQVRQRANYIIDTSNLSIKELQNEIISIFESDDSLKKKMDITFLSFGFKYGIPIDSDMMFDVRFLPNPFYIEELKHHSGLEAEVKEYIWKWPVTRQFVEKLNSLVDFLLPQYEKEGKSNLVIAFGCTGGLHRSIFIAEKLADHFKNNGYRINIEHRDIEKALKLK